MGQTFILGDGMTGLAAGYLSGLPVYEATGEPERKAKQIYMKV